MEIESKKCRVSDCSRSRSSNGYCKMHYERLRRYGRLENLIKESTNDKLIRMHIKDVNECWNFTGTILRTGYGAVKFNGKNYLAHRLSYLTFVGEIGDKLVCHKCDNRKCINPDHLWLGNLKDNALDMVKKGRRADTRGENSPTSKLTEKDVLKIRASKASLSELSKKYKVLKTTICSIKTRRNWKHI